MNKFQAIEVCVQMGNLAITETQLVQHSYYAGEFYGRDQVVVGLLSHIIHVSRALESARLEDDVRLFNLMQERIAEGRLDNSALAAEARNAKAILLGALRKLQFLYVAPDRLGYIDQEKPFGDAVDKGFPSATPDLREAGNCLAAECSTGTVFHLIRAAEFALRALAKDRDVSYPHSSVDEQQCGQLIIAMDSKLSALRAADKKLWPSETVKNEQIRFYHSALIEFRSFNEAWRKHVCHAGGNSFYDRHQAISIFGHVRALMQGIAPKISETSTTPQYWTTT